MEEDGDDDFVNLDAFAYDRAASSKGSAEPEDGVARDARPSRPASAAGLGESEKPKRPPRAPVM